MTLTMIDRTGTAFQVEDGAVAADGDAHVIAVPLGGDKPLYPLRVASITLSFGMPLRSAPPLALTLTGLSLSGWKQQATTPSPINFPPSEVGPALRRDDPRHRADGDVHLRRGPRARRLGRGRGPGSIQHVAAQLTLLPPAARVLSIPAIATSAFMTANSQQIGSIVPESVDGWTVPMRIVAVVASFPTVTASGGALITDLGRVQSYLAQRSLTPLPVTQWWLATAGGRIPPALAAAVRPAPRSPARPG